MVSHGSVGCWVQVLRFFALWDDRASLCGDRRPFVINFYLADDTVEVLEVRHLARKAI